MYIGREFKDRSGKLISASVWANPFRLRDCKDLDECLGRFDSYLQANPRLMDRLHELAGRRLLCHCRRGAPCHADTIARAFRHAFASGVPACSVTVGVYFSPEEFVVAAAQCHHPFEPLSLLYNNTAVVFGLVYVSLRFMVLPLYAALDRLDRSYLEASLDLDAGHIRTFLSIVVPLALPGIASGIVITFIPAMGSYLTPDLPGRTDSQMIANVIASQFKQANNWPFGAALSFLLMYATFFALAVRAVLMRKEGRGDAG